MVVVCSRTGGDGELWWTTYVPYGTTGIKSSKSVCSFIPGERLNLGPFERRLVFMGVEAVCKVSDPVDFVSGG